MLQSRSRCNVSQLMVTVNKQSLLNHFPPSLRGYIFSLFNTKQGSNSLGSRTPPGQPYSSATTNSTGRDAYATCWRDTEIVRLHISQTSIGPQSCSARRKDVVTIQESRANILARSRRPRLIMAPPTIHHDSVAYQVYLSHSTHYVCNTEHGHENEFMVRPEELEST